MPERWPGGYVRQGRKGPAFIIERWIGGRRYHVSTLARNLRAALKQLDRFEMDPASYDPRRDHSARLEITRPLANEYVDWMLTRPRPASRRWALSCGELLADWMDDLRAKDIRRLSIPLDIEPALARHVTDRAPSGRRMHRIEALKAFCSWMRRVKGLLRHAEDPTLDLTVPQASPEKLRRRKALPRSDFRKLMRHLAGPARDFLMLQSATAWHCSEVRRFAERGTVEAHSDYLAVVGTPHKSGRSHHIGLRYPEHHQAAKRIRASGRALGEYELRCELERACELAGIERFHAGWMRHSVLSWAREDGASLKDIAAFAGHTSERTTAAFYVREGIPAPAVPVLRVVRGGRR